MDNTTFRAIYERVFYVVGASREVETICSIRRLENNVLKYAYTFVNGSASDACPDVSDLPVGNETGSGNLGDISKVSLVFVPDSALPQAGQTVCVNETQTTTQWTLPLSVKPAKAYGDAPICANFTNTGGPNNAQGTWLDGVRNFAVISTTQGSSSSLWDNTTVTSSLATLLGVYNTSQCMNGAVSGAAQWVQARYLNGSDGPGKWICAGFQTGPNPLNGNPVMNFYFPIPMPPPANGTLPKPQLTFNQLAPLPGKPNMTCVNPEVTPTCTWKGLWKISPLFHPCNRHYLSYATKCTVDAVKLATRESLASSTNWGLNYTATTTGSSNYDDILAIRPSACKDTILSGPDLTLLGSPALSLRNKPYLLKLVPYKGNCDVVYIVAKNGPNGNNYLSAPNTCNGFLWTAKPSGRARFVLTKASELIGGVGGVGGG